MIDLWRLSSRSLGGQILRLPLRLVPRGLVVPIMQGPLRGARWIVGSSTHGCWLGCYEARMQALCARLVRPGMTVYDLGANVGFYTLLFSRLVGPGALVHAFEPVGRNVWYLRRHLELNPKLKATVHELAVGRESGMVTFDFSSGWSMGRVVARPEANTSRLPAVSLDDFVYAQGREPPDLIKMDIEGGEVNAIAGMSRLLAERFPVLLVSVHGSSRWRECVAVLKAAGYTVLDPDGMPARPEAARDDLLALPAESARRRPGRESASARSSTPEDGATVGENQSP